MDGLLTENFPLDEATAKPAGRLICISNRIPTGPDPSGGLVVALADMLERSGGIWIGAAPEVVETPSEQLEPIPGGPFRRLTFGLTAEEKASYYAGFSNSVLWPLFHDRADLMELRPSYYEGYLAVNRRIARLIAAELQPGDRIWVHDYHLLPLAHELRALGVTVPIGFFLHTPFPTHIGLQALSWGAELCRWMVRYDLIGLQAERDVVNMVSGLKTVGGAQDMPDGRIAIDGHSTRISAFPIGIDASDFATLAEAEFDRLPEGIVKARRRMLIGVDRLDYSKGVPQRFRAFERFLELNEDWHRHVSLLQISPPTRAGVKAYDDIRRELELLEGQINGRFADIAWAPIRYIHRSIPRPQLAGLYRAAHAALVTPLMDGMNLVAKEFIAAQNPEDPGVLILSHFAGAAEQMQDALLVNPHDAAQISEAMAQALTMPQDERRRRYERLMEGLQSQDVHWWATSFLEAFDRSVAEAALTALPELSPDQFSG